MRDPFALLPPADIVNMQLPSDGKPQKSPTSKRVYVVVGVLTAVVIFLSAGLIILQRQLSASADQPANYVVDLKIDNLPSAIKTGDKISPTLSIVNQGAKDLAQINVLVCGNGVDLSDTINLAQNFKENESGFLRPLTPSEKDQFGFECSSGFYYFVGTLGAKQMKSQQIKANVVGSTSTKNEIQSKAYLVADKNVSCGFLGLKQCDQKGQGVQIGFGATQVPVGEQKTIRLLKGYNLLSIPRIFTAGAAKELLNSFRDHKAYLYDPTTAGYIDLNASDNASRIKPGVGFWVMDSLGGDYPLPSTSVETDKNNPFTIDLQIGWNQIGNPYQARVIFSADKILVQELSEDSSATGTTNNLKTSTDNGALSSFYVLSYDSSSSNGNPVSTYKTLAYNDIIVQNAGIFVENRSGKKLRLVFPGKDAIAPGDLLSQDEKTRIEQWIVNNGLNQYGDSQGTVYSGGTPLFDEAIGVRIDRYDYILQKNPNRPWNS